MIYLNWNYEYIEIIQDINYNESYHLIEIKNKLLFILLKIWKLEDLKYLYISFIFNNELLLYLIINNL